MTTEETLLQFAVEPSHDKDTLIQYMKEHPACAVELADLAFNLNRPVPPPKPQTPEEELADMWLIDRALKSLHLCYNTRGG